MSLFSRLRGSRTQADSPLGDLKLALDFGTSTTLVAVKIGSAEPRLIPLEDGSPELPSYLATSSDGEFLYGSAAVNAQSHVHSLKLLLRENRVIEDLGFDAERAAHILIDEAVRRALARLRAEGTLRDEVGTLTVAMNVGCTPAFNLAQRLRLRDICLDLGMQVRLINLVEEPVAAAFEIGRAGVATSGRAMIIDIGGGTLDVAVMRIGTTGADFVVFATSGTELGGDRFTNVIVEYLKLQLASARGVPVDGLRLTPEDRSALWNRAELAKLSLSTREAAVVALPGGAEVTVTREWFRHASALLVEQIAGFVTGVYRQARLTLDRGELGDPQPGGVTVSLDEDGNFQDVRGLRLGSDGQEHLDHVFLVGGASRMPAIRDRFGNELRSRMLDPAVFGIDPVHAVVLGLGRHEQLDRLELRYPNWQVVAVLASPDGRGSEIQLYEPFAPTFRLTMDGPTATYAYTAELADGVNWESASLEFRPVVRAAGEVWPAVALPEGATSLTLKIDLFGSVTLLAGGVDLYPKMVSPFALDGRPRADWLPKKQPDPAMPEFCIHGATRGRCSYVACPYHAFGGIAMDED